jgi:hypothetical protein
LIFPHYFRYKEDEVQWGVSWQGLFRNEMMRVQRPAERGTPYKILVKGKISRYAAYTYTHAVCCV